MKIKRMGRTGLNVSEVCLGTMTFHSRVENNEKVSESLAQDVVNALK